jgi:hypothetical protein
MRVRHWLRPLLCLLLISLPTAAWAGMPYYVLDESARSVVLTDAGHLRWRAISFFLAVLLLSALAVRWLWNRLASDFPKLPRLTYRRAMGVVFLWGTLCLVVLTMIAATREMMTPGVWQKQGLLYTIPATAPPQGATVKVHAVPKDPSSDDSTAGRWSENSP